MLLENNNQENNGLDATLKALTKGKIIGFPTETVFGIACNAASEIAIDKIYKIKRRDKEKPLQIMVAEFRQIEEFAIVNNSAKIIAEKFWPGPLTIVLKKKSPFILAGNISGDDSVGIRIPKHPLLLELLKKYGKPIAATSANLSGEKSPSKYSDVNEKIKREIAAILAEEFPSSGNGSTVVDLKGGEFKILRAGDISKEKIRAALNVI